MVASGAADIGIIPSFELLGQDLGMVPGVGIACRGAVRSILLVSRNPAARNSHLAADSSSRTSVALHAASGARVTAWSRRCGACAGSDRYAGEADSALIIGDPALRIDPEKRPFPRAIWAWNGRR